MGTVQHFIDVFLIAAALFFVANCLAVDVEKTKEVLDGLIEEYRIHKDFDKIKERVVATRPSDSLLPTEEKLVAIKKQFDLAIEKPKIAGGRRLQQPGFNPWDVFCPPCAIIDIWG